MRLTVLIGVVVFALLAFSAVPAEAAAPAVGGEAGHKKEVDLVLFAGIVFAVLLALLIGGAWPQIRQMLDSREESIAHDKREAEKARQEAGELRQKIQAELAKMNDQMRQMRDKAQQDARQTAAEELARGKAELAAERDRLQREIRISTDDALHRLWEESAQLATLISSKAIRNQLGEDDHRTLIGEALNEFRSTAEARLRDVKEARA